jgi:basic membrane protein A
LQQLREGADLVFAAGGETADAALEAAARHGTLVIGSETDLYERLPRVRPRLVTSAVNDIRSGVLELVGLARKGGMKPGEYWGRIGLAPFHDLAGAVTSEARARILAIQSALLDGSIQLEIPYKAP